ncbi:Serpentine receptor class gamma [Meloidogyne graminicola]|uniref:Serpentine receptor class gamma n=1 Tax=Meloidogyne graminicola TaxID=189291 RepID=A0A8S9ZPN7_9BILA|nr:Serpentine receptor class gamma [Meloidogyne graminicola]
MSTKNNISSLDIYISQSIGAIISIPSVILYLIECLIIIKNFKQFNSSFYKLFLLSAFNNIFMNFLPSILYARLIRLGWINNFYLKELPNWGPNLLVFFMYYNYHFENFITICTLLHRLSVIAYPFNYEKKWNIFLPICGIFIFITPLLFTYRFIYWPLIMVVNDDNSVEINLNKILIKDKPVLTNYMIMLLTSIGYLIINIFLNLAVYLMYRKKQTNISTNNSNINNNKSSRLLVYTIAIFLAQLLLCLFWLLLTIQGFGELFPSNYNLIFTNQYIWLSDIRTVAFPSWFLLWASTDLNDKIRQRFPWIPSFKSKIIILNNSEHKMNIGIAKINNNNNISPNVRSFTSSNSQELLANKKRHSGPLFVGIQTKENTKISKININENCGINGCELRK